MNKTLKILLFFRTCFTAAGLLTAKWCQRDPPIASSTSGKPAPGRSCTSCRVTSGRWTTSISTRMSRSVSKTLFKSIRTSLKADAWAVKIFGADFDSCQRIKKLSMDQLIRLSFAGVTLLDFSLRNFFYSHHPGCYKFSCIVSQVSDKSSIFGQASSWSLKFVHFFQSYLPAATSRSTSANSMDDAAVQTLSTCVSLESMWKMIEINISIFKLSFQLLMILEWLAR